MPTVQFFFFQVFEKAFYYSIVIRMAFDGKGLNHVECINLFAEIRRGELAASIRMKHNPFRNTSAPDGIP